MRGRGHTLLAAAMIAASFLPGPKARAEDSTAAQGRPADRRVEIINDTDVAMTQFFATNVGVDGWGKDHLGDRVLEANQRLTLNFEDGSGACWFDFKAVFDDGDVVERRNFNVCKETGWRVFQRKPGETEPGEVGQRV